MTLGLTSFFGGAARAVAAHPLFEYLICPEETISPFEDAILDRASGGDDLLSNRGYDETGHYTSPYWTCRAAGTQTPVYAAMCYDGGADINDVTFENIEIYRDTGRAIFVMVTNKDLRNCKIKDVVFRNVSYTADVKSRIASVIKPTGGEKVRLWFFRFFKQTLPFGWLDGKLENPAVNGNEIEVTFDNVTANGCKLGRFNFGRYFTTSGNEDLLFR